MEKEKKEVEESKDAPEEKKEEIAEEAPEKEEAKEEQEDALSELSKEGKKLIEQVESMTVLELNTLVKAIEKKFGVSAQAVAVPSGATEGEAEEKSTFTVELTGSGEQKIAVIKAVKEILGLGLKDAKDLVDDVPSSLKEDIGKEEAEEIKKKIEEAGGKVELK